MSSNANRGFGRYLTEEGQAEAEAKSQAAQQRRERIAGSIRGGYARYDRSGNAVDPDDKENFDNARPRTQAPHSTASDRGFGRHLEP